MPRPLRKATIEAIAQYYLHASNQHSIRWNKKADLDAIGETLTKSQVLTAVTGTFWVVDYQKTKTVTYYTTKKLFPTFTITQERIK